MASINRKDRTGTKTEVTGAEVIDILKEQNIISEEKGRYYLTSVGQFFFSENEDNRNNVTNPYIAARREWDERNGSLIAQVSNLWKTLIGAIVIIILLVIGMISVAMQSKVIPFYIALDKLHNAYPLGVPQETKASEGDVERQLMNYIEDLRSFSSDPNVNAKNIQIISSMSSQSLSDQIDTIIKTNASDPNLSTITVTITNITGFSNTSNPTGAEDKPGIKSYSIDWTETRKSTDGTEASSYWRAIVSYKKLPIDNISILQGNPFGLLITQLQISPKLVTSSTGAQ